MKECIICGRPNSQEHHKVFKSECKPLKNCKMNKVYLCIEHHQGKCGVHGKYGDELNLKLKLEFQNWLEEIFTEERYSLEDIRKKLGISKNAARSLSKLMHQEIGTFKREDIIIQCMGGQLCKAS